MVIFPFSKEHPMPGFGMLPFPLLMPSNNQTSSFEMVSYLSGSDLFMQKLAYNIFTTEYSRDLSP
jgi:hypothetical protein